MKDDVGRPQRRSIRLRDYDYAQAGAYFVTIVTTDRTCLFGEIVLGEMRPNQFGRIVETTWTELLNHYAGVEHDVFVVMPNHIHGIVVLSRSGDSDVGAGFKPARALSEIVRGFKTFSARRINEIRTSRGVSVWQRNYYEHVVRGGDELVRIRGYVANNPLQWELDRENPLQRKIESRKKRELWEV